MYTKNDEVMFNPKLWFRFVVLKYAKKYVDAHKIQQEMNLKLNIDNARF